MWTLLIVVVTGSVFSTSAGFVTLPMQDKAACVAASENLSKKSRGVGFICISSTTGEIIRTDYQEPVK